MTITNYQDERIPEIVGLSKDVLSSIDQIYNIKKYKFADLFSKEKRYYSTNKETFNAIGFNVKLEKSSEIQGAYIFYKDDEPVYVGISRKLIRRLRNHFLGKSHFEASLVYLMARDNYDSKKGIYMGTRADFPFDDYRSEIQEEMIANWSISIIPELDNYRLYYLEFVLACKLQTKWNCFMTH